MLTGVDRLRGYLARADAQAAVRAVEPAGPLAPTSEHELPERVLLEGRMLYEQVTPTRQPPDDGAVYENAELHGCTLRSNRIGWGRDLARRAIVRNVRLVRCNVEEFDVGPVILEDVVLDHLRVATKSHLGHSLAGIACNRVSLRGDIPMLMFNPVGLTWAPPLDQDGRRRSVLIERQNAAYYRQVTWALDISEARFSAFAMKPGIPADLIRRDPVDQIVVRRVNADGHDWQELRGELPDGAVALEIEELLASPYPDVVIVAGKRSTTRGQRIETFKALRSMGVADAD